MSAKVIALEGREPRAVREARNIARSSGYIVHVRTTTHVIVRAWDAERSRSYGPDRNFASLAAAQKWLTRRDDAA